MHSKQYNSEYFYNVNTKNSQWNIPGKIRFYISTPTNYIQSKIYKKYKEHIANIMFGNNTCSKDNYSKSCFGLELCEKKWIFYNI